MEETIYPFDETFQTQLIARLVRDKVFFYKYHSFIKAGYFVEVVWQQVYTILENYYETYHDSLTAEILRNEIKKIIDKSLKKKNAEGDENFEQDYNNKLDILLSTDISAGEEYTAEKVVEFAKRRELRITMIDNFKNIEKDDFDFQKLTSRVSEIQAMGSNIDAGYDFFDDTIRRTSRIHEISENKVGTGFNTLNKALDGGLGPGELGVVVGPPSRGKTATMVNLAVGALLNRKNVIYFGFEGSLDELTIRFDMRLAHCSKEDLYKQPEKVRDDVIAFIKYLRKKLIIKMYPAESVTVSDIDNFLNYTELTTNFVPDLIIIDPLYLCKSLNAREDTWKGRNYAEGKAMADRRRKPLWTSVQAKLDSLSTDIVTPRDISEATIRIWGLMDVMIGLCQTEEDKNKIPPTMRFYLGKNRNKEAHWIIPVIFHTEKMLIEEFIL